MINPKWVRLAKGLTFQQKEKRYVLSDNPGRFAEISQDCAAAVVVNGGCARAEGEFGVALALGSSLPRMSSLCKAISGTDGASIAWGDGGEAKTGIGGTAIGLGLNVVAKCESFGTAFSVGDAEGKYGSIVIAGQGKAAKAGPNSLLAIFYRDTSNHLRLAVGYTSGRGVNVVKPYLTPDVWHRVDPTTGQFYECPPP